MAFAIKYAFNRKITNGDTNADWLRKSNSYSTKKSIIYLIQLLLIGHKFINLLEIKIKRYYREFGYVRDLSRGRQKKVPEDIVLHIWLEKKILKNIKTKSI